MKNDGIVADTNIIKYYYDDVSHDEFNFQRKLIDSICDNCGFVINEQIYWEYELKITTFGFKDWLGTMMWEGKIDYINERSETKLSPHNKNIIHDKFGLPRNNSKDIHFIICANHTTIKYIITNDIDFFDPKKKEVNSENREKIINQRSGQLCHFLEKKLGILVGLPTHCHQTLCEKKIMPPIMTE